MNDYKKPNKLDGVEQKLYSPNSEIKQKPRSGFNMEETDIATEWVDEVNQESGVEKIKKENKKGMTAFTKILIGAALFFIVALGYAFFIFGFKGNAPAQNVDININSPVTVAAGELFTFDVIIENNNPVNMESIDLAIEYPEGTRNGEDIAISLPRERTDIGSVASGTYIRETRGVYLFGEEGDTKEIEVKIIYRTPDSNAVFEKRKVFDVSLKSTPIRMNLSSVKEITAGQPIDFDLEIISNANEPLTNVLVRANYPFGFIYEGSSISPSSSNNVWLIDSLDPKESIELNIYGQVQGQNNDDKYFSFDVGLQDDERLDEIAVLFTQIGKTVEVSRPFLEIDLAVDKDNSSVINLDSSKTQNFEIIYKNNTRDIIRDAKITLEIKGDVLNEASVNVPKGFYKSLDNTVTWDKTTEPKLSQIAVGESGNLTLTMASLNLVNDIQVKNPELSFKALVEGTRYSEDDVPEEIVNEIFKTIRYQTVVYVNPVTLYYDGPFENSGPFPPKVDQKTEYTVSFNILNSSNRVSGGKLQMRLPNYVEFENQTWPSTENVTYDSRNRIVTWDIGEIKEISGFSGDGRKMAFQVSIIPSITQKGSVPDLAESITFTGTDLFTGNAIQKQLGNVDTATADARNYYDETVTE